MPPRLSRSLSLNQPSRAAATTTTTTTGFTAIPPCRISPKALERLHSLSRPSVDATCGTTHHINSTVTVGGEDWTQLNPSNAARWVSGGEREIGNTSHEDSLLHLQPRRKGHNVLPTNNFHYDEVPEQELETGGIGSNSVHGALRWNGTNQQNVDYRDETPMMGVRKSYVVDVRNEESNSRSPLAARIPKTTRLDRTDSYTHIAQRVRKDNDYSDLKQSNVEYFMEQKWNPARKEPQSTALNRTNEIKTDGGAFFQPVPLTVGSSCSHGASTAINGLYGLPMFQPKLSSPLHLNGLQSRVRGQGGVSFSSTSPPAVDNKEAATFGFVQHAPFDLVPSSRLEEIRGVARKHDVGDNHGARGAQRVEFPLATDNTLHFGVVKSRANSLCPSGNASNARRRRTKNNHGVVNVPVPDPTPVPTPAPVSVPSERSTNAIHFVFDTCSLLALRVCYLNALLNCGVVCFPSSVISELDSMNNSKGPSPPDRNTKKRSFAARRVRNWIIDNSDKDCKIRVQRKCEVEPAYDSRTETKDDSILGFAVYLRQKERLQVVFITDDKFLRVKAAAELGGGVLSWQELVKQYKLLSTKTSSTRKPKKEK